MNIIINKLIQQTFESNLPIYQKIALLINTRKRVDYEQQKLCNYYLTKLYEIKFGKGV